MAKTASFGILHLCTSFGVTYALTGNVAIAGAVTFVEPLVNTVMHRFFDKYWAHPKLQAVGAQLRGRSRAADQVPSAMLNQA